MGVTVKELMDGTITVERFVTMDVENVSFTVERKGENLQLKAYLL